MLINAIFGSLRKFRYKKVLWIVIHGWAEKGSKSVVENKQLER